MRQWQILALPTQTASSHFKLQQSVLRINTTPQQWKAKKHTGKGGWGKWKSPSFHSFAFSMLPTELGLPIPRELLCLENSGWWCCIWGCRASWAAEDQELQQWLVGFGSLWITGGLGSVWRNRQQPQPGTGRGKRVQTHGHLEWWRGNWFGFRGRRTTATQPFFHSLPPNRQVEEKQEKPTRNIVFIFVSASPRFSFLLSTYIKKVLKGTKRKQKSSWINHNTNFRKRQFCLCVTSSLPLTHQSWPASIRSWICPGQGTSE